MTRNLTFAAALAAILIGIAVCYQSAAFSSRSGDDTPVYSIRRHDPYGTAALMDLLIERGVEVRTLEQPNLEPTDHGVLVQVLPCSQARGRGDYHLSPQQLADWISDGNTVIQLTRAPTGLMERFKIIPTTQPVFKDIWAIQDAEASGETPSSVPGQPYVARLQVADHQLASLEFLANKRLILRSPMEFADQKNAPWTPLARVPTKSDAVVAGEYRIGRGKLILVGAPTPALNGALGDEANLDFLLAVIGRGPVIFDEWSHGVGHEATVVGFLHDVGLLPALLQAAFIALLYAWSTSGHHRPDNPDTARQRSSTEQIATLGFLYSRSLSPDVAIERVRSEIQRRFAESLRCTHQELKASIARLKPDLAGKIRQLFTELARVQPPHQAHCQTCGYDLTHNQSGKCPECGTLILGELHRQIAKASADPGNVESSQRRPRPDPVFAEVLTLSHQLSQEIQRERRAT